MAERHVVPANHGAHSLLLLSTTSQAANLAAPSSPAGFARLIVGAALAFSAIYALLSSSATTAFAPDLLASPPSAPASSTSRGTHTPAVASMPVLRTPDQFDSFVRASSSAGFLCIVLFHAPWCAASLRTETVLAHLSSRFTGRRIVFARVDCSIQADGARQQRCDLTELHRVHRTPTVRMYHANSCVDEITGCRPVDIRQAVSDLSFKFGL